ncbi:MAG TPA: aldo/keto reductase [Chthoniobacterales bacterium]|nr:aldo/keto reductase [Chthoniobacterales bacterium]
MSEKISRREAARLIAGTAATLLLSRNVIAQEKGTMITRAIASSGEKLPVIGLGTWQSFDVGSSAADRAPLEEVLAAFVRLGGRVIDSSPMYGRAEGVVGDLAQKLRLRDSLFLATKVWTTGKEAGVRSMERSFELMKTKRMDLMQVHNLVDVQTHLATLRDWKQQGRIRYIGITHYTASSHDDIARVLQREQVDFVQINYSVREREAEERVLPVAQERGVAVIVNRPFGGGNLFSRVRDKALPDFAAEIGCESWAQLFLKWIIAHPAVTCAIPATSKLRHLEDNMRGGVGALPDAKMRQRILQTVADL